MFAVDIMIIYALAVYGGPLAREDVTRARSGAGLPRRHRQVGTTRAAPLETCTL